LSISQARVMVWFLARYGITAGLACAALMAA
jgi:hypothetical protein